jgi:hypothetical protein
MLVPALLLAGCAQLPPSPEDLQAKTFQVPPDKSVTLTTAPGRIYFLEHTVQGDRDDGGVTNVRLREIGDQAGRNLVMHSQLLM